MPASLNRLMIYISMIQSVQWHPPPWFGILPPCEPWEGGVVVMVVVLVLLPRLYGGFPKVVVPNNHGFPTKNDHFGVFWGHHHLI